MAWKTLTVIGSYLCVCICALQRSLQFDSVPISEVSSRDYVVLETRTSDFTVIQCGVECISDLYCSMFLYNNESFECALLGVIDQVRPLPTAVSDDQWQAFAINSNCPHMYARYVDQCWSIHTDLVGRDAASMSCDESGGQLIELKEWEVFLFLGGVLSARPGISGLNVWTNGLRNSGNNFVWKNGLQTVNSDMFADDQPDGHGGVGQDCVDMRAPFNFYLNDIDCFQNAAYVCDYEM